MPCVYRRSMTVYARAGPDGVHEATASRGQPCPAPVATLSQKQKTCHTPALPCWAGQRSRYLARTARRRRPALRLGVSVCALCWG